jgi:hypothetical protein
MEVGAGAVPKAPGMRDGQMFAVDHTENADLDRLYRRAGAHILIGRGLLPLCALFETQKEGDFRS